MFYSISNCQKGLRGISFGNFLIKQVVDDLKRELPDLDTFVTLSPVPDFADWLARERGESLQDAAEALAPLDEPGWHADPVKAETVRKALLPAAAHYFLKARRRAGARSTRWRASISATAPAWSGSTFSATRRPRACGRRTA